MKTFNFNLEQLRKINTEKEGKIKLQDEEIASLKVSCRMYQSHHESLTTKLADKELEVQNLSEEKADHERQLEMLRNTREEEKEKIKSQEEEINFLKDSKDVEVKRLEEEKEDFEQEMHSLEGKIEKLKSDQASGRAKRTRLEAKMKLMKNKIVDLKREEHSKLVEALKIYR